MNLNFYDWLCIQEATSMMGTTGTDPGEPTPTGSAPNKKVTYAGNAGSGGGPGKVDPPKAAGCSGGPCPPKNQTTPKPSGSGGAAGAAMPAGAAPTGAAVTGTPTNDPKTK